MLSLVKRNPRGLPKANNVQTPAKRVQKNRRNKRKPALPKAKPKVRAVPAKVPKNKSRKVKNAVRSKGVVNQIIRETTFRRKVGCLMPNDTVIDLTFNNSWRLIIDTIDMFIHQAQIEQPQCFLRAMIDSGATIASIADPQVAMVAVRAAWLMAANAYLVRIGVVNGANVSLTQVASGILIPNGLAKFLQHFAPYVDTVTGSIIRFTVPFLDTNAMLVMTGYPDVSSDSTAAGTIDLNLNCFVNTYLLHPSLYTAGAAQSPDYVTNMTRTNPTYALPSPNNRISLATYFQINLTSSSYIKTAINKLYNGVESTDISCYAPDASFYAQITPNGVTSPFYAFDPVMTLIGPQLLANGSQADQSVNYPFMKGFPAVGLNKPGNIIGSTAQFAIVYRKTYAVFTGQVHRYVSTTNGVGQLRYTRAFGAVRNFELKGCQISYAMIAERLTEYLQNLNGNNQTPTQSTLFGLVTAFWCAIIDRVAPYDWISDFASTYAGYAMGTNAYQKLPIVLSSIIASIGPVIVDGRLYIPYFGQTVTGWYASVNAGSWTPVPNNINTVLQTQIFYSSGTQYPINDATGGPINPANATLFTVGSPLFAEFFTENSYMNTGENWSQAVQPSKCPLGSIPMMLSGVSIALPQIISNSDAITVSVASVPITWQRRYMAKISSVSSNTCITHFDAARVAMMGLISNLTVTNPEAYVRAQSISCNTNPVSFLSQVQLAMVGVGNDVSKGTAAALAKLKDIKFKDGVTQGDMMGKSPYAALQKLLAQEIQAKVKDIFHIESSVYSVSKFYTDFVLEFGSAHPSIEKFAGKKTVWNLDAKSFVPTTAKVQEVGSTLESNIKTNNSLSVGANPDVRQVFN